MPNSAGRIPPVSVPKVPWHELNAAVVDRVERIVADFDAMDRRRQRCVSVLEVMHSLRRALGQSDPEAELYCGD